MPQIVILFGVGAGLVAGYKWLTREVQKHTDAAKAREDDRRQTEARDLGALEWDEASGSYRPKHR